MGKRGRGGMDMICDRNFLVAFFIGLVRHTLDPSLFFPTNELVDEQLY